MATRMYVSDDLSIMAHGENLVIQSQVGHDEGAVGVNEAELPALLRELEKAARGMGVETEKAELVKACKALLAAFEGYEMLAALPIDVAEMARAAIAKAEQ